MPLRDRVVLVTGANGFVGSRFVRRLAEGGGTVRTLVRRAGSAPDLARPEVSEIVGDFVEPETARQAAAGVHFVVHCAATVGTDLDEARRVNAHGTGVIVRAALDAGCERLVHISSAAVYEYGDRPVVDETTPLVTGPPQYGLTKAEAEEFVREGMRRGLPSVILRPTAILGVHPSSSWSHRVPDRVREGKLPLVRDGGNTWSYVHVENLADALLLALGKDEAVGEAFNVADGQTTWKAYTDEIRRWFGAPEPPSVEPDPAAGRSYWTGRIDATKIRERLGYAPRLTLEDGMRETERYWRQQIASPGRSG